MTLTHLDLDRIDGLAGRLRKLSTIDFGGSAAGMAVEAMSEAASDLTAMITRIRELEGSGSVSAAQAAYGALWWFQSSTPSLHDARKHLLTTIGGQGADEQRAAIAWALRAFGEPLNLDPHESPATWAEAEPALQRKTS